MTKIISQTIELDVRFWFVFNYSDNWMNSIRCHIDTYPPKNGVSALNGSISPKAFQFLSIVTLTPCYEKSVRETDLQEVGVT
jgi:hypothetical protein